MKNFKIIALLLVFGLVINGCQKDDSMIQTSSETINTIDQKYIEPLPYEGGTTGGGSSNTYYKYVKAHQYNNDTYINAVEGERYKITASGHWWDNLVRTGADGFNCGLCTNKKRMSDEKWLKLCAEIDGVNYAIGSSATITVSQSGRMYLYANDNPGAYWNNSGGVSVTIKRL